jgi:hypothetical protein
VAARTVTLAEAIAAIRTLGAPPAGSPAQVRAHASHLRRTADQLDGAARLLESCAHVGGYLGPAARRHESSTAHEAAMLRQRIARLRDLANRLDGEAGGLDNRQRTWRSRYTSKANTLPSGLAARALAALGWRMP